MQTQTRSLRIRGGTLIDGLGGPPVPNPGILIRGRAIVAIGAAAHDDFADAAPADVVDASGKFIMPGLIDGHVHISSSQGALPGIRFAHTPEYAALWTARAVAKILYAGVTSISVPGGKWFIDAGIRDAVEAGLIEGPRIYCAGMPLGPVGNIFDSTDPYTGVPKTDGVCVVYRSPDDYRQAIRLQAKRGVDMIKVADSYWGDKQTIHADELTGIVDDAHQLDLTVSIHARGSGTTLASARAGVDWIFHADLASEADLDAVARAGVPIMPVFTQCQVIAETDGIPGVGPRTRRRVAEQLEIAYGTIRKARARGIKLLMGTDSGNTACYEQGIHHGREAELMVKHIGMSPMEAIVAFTRDNARVVGLEGKVGTIEPDRYADIIIWDADPVADISVLYRRELLHTVIKDGRVIDRSAIRYRDLDREPPKADVTPQG